ncbi:spermidine/putrescine transport system substrate-binding protein [Dethiosulfatibacter aminovorans DSM 17477]|uniref:Spermidine/putrescine transport system substrate-binding protein n=1 Tax=Dethiosulfatibacter aminovorans DSM 17477 TaxID=1121476 RepID=A0A1M6BJ98_9FIRM|nr:ABC transporter substrate-binding protein [Dethiosulfatibacter aminovorans]SHI48802.1 spermidine/putrescine transport system substrate-binding protein [Dethiosulfatibacter aminovorans DSM 17477]
MKRRISVLLVLAFILALSAGCAQEEKPVLNVFNYGEYIDMDLLDEFEEEYGIEVNYEIYPTPEDMYTKVKAGATDFDLIISSDYMIERLINEGMVNEINYDNIPNYQYIMEEFKKQPYDPDGKYTVPYFWGTLGILYNTEVVEGTPDSWDLLWDEKYSGQILMMDSQRDSLAAALKKLGYSLNTLDEGELEEARDLLIQQKPLVMAYVVDEVRDMMIGDEAAIALLWSGEAVAAMGENEKLNYYVPKEGSNIWVDAMFMPSNAKNVEEAEKFIDFLCRKETTLRNIDYVWYSTVHDEAVNEVEEFLFDNPGFNPSAEILDRVEMFRDLGDKIEAYDRVWTEVLSH